MNEILNDQEIFTLLRESNHNPLPLTQILEQINHKRIFQNKKPIGKTALYNKLEKLTDSIKIRHIQRKGYYIEEFSDEMDEKIEDLFQCYKKLSQKKIGLILEKSGKLAPTFLITKLEPYFQKLQNNIDSLFEEGMLVKPSKKNEPYLEINFEWASAYDICPICLEKVDLEKVHYEIDVESKTSSFHYSTCHNQCISGIFNQENLPRKLKTIQRSVINAIDEMDKPDLILEKNIEKIEIDDDFDAPDWIDAYHRCATCGISTDLDFVFRLDRYNSGSIYTSEHPAAKMTYLIELSKELYGDVSTMYWAQKNEVGKFNINLHKVIRVGDAYYHPLCAQKIHKHVKEGGD